MTTDILDPMATPLTPVVLDVDIELPATARSVALVLLDTGGRRIGEVARCIVSEDRRTHSPVQKERLTQSEE